MRKYYFDESPYIYDNIMSKWEFIISYIQTYGDYLEVVESVTESSDKECRVKIQKLLKEYASYFESAKPIDRTISLSPFIVKYDYISVCFKYKINDELIKELETNWLKVLKEELCIQPFIVFSNNTPIFWVHHAGIVILLEDGVKRVFDNAGFKLEEWKISLNESLYSIMSSEK
jgi:hypothetical protein